MENFMLGNEMWNVNWSTLQFVPRQCCIVLINSPFTLHKASILCTYKSTLKVKSSLTSGIKTNGRYVTTFALSTYWDNDIMKNNMTDMNSKRLKKLKKRSFLDDVFVSIISDCVVISRCHYAASINSRGLFDQ